MASSAVDVVAGGPPPVDPYEPAAPAWALAEGLAVRGRTVRVLYASAPAASRPPGPSGVAAVPVEVRLRRPGSASDPAEFAREAGAHLSPDAVAVLRDPVGLGVLGTPRRPSRPRVVGFVHGLGISEFDRVRSKPGARGVAARIDSWREGHTIRRLEKAAIAEADRLVFDDAEVGTALAREYAVPAGRMLAVARAVARGPTPPEWATARGALGLPTDVPVVAALCSSEAPGPSGADRAREAFQRVRPFFSGARLVVAGSTVPLGPGLVVAPRRDTETFVRALAAADVAVFPPRVAGFDPGVVLALRQGVAAVTLPTVRLPADVGRAVRVVESDDPGDLASALADLLADLAQRRELAARGRELAPRFDPGTVVGELEGAGVLPAP
jgi:hypothetical protein